MKILKLVYFAIFYSLLIVSCKQDTGVVQVDEFLDIAISKEPQMIHPFVNHLASSRIVYQNIFLPLADFDPVTYKLEPILIKEVPEGKSVKEGPYKGGTEYTIEFREEAKWDNGTPITAKDILFSIKSILHPGTNTAAYSSYMKWLTDIRIDESNPRKAKLYFKDYYILAKELIATIELYPQYFYDPSGSLDKISLKELQTDNAQSKVDADADLVKFAEDFNSIKYGREMISGAGPYAFDKWISNQLIVLKKKQNYWGKALNIPALKAGPEKIVFHIIPDETTVISQMKEGNIDVFGDMSANTFFDLKENKTYKNQFEFYTPELMKFYYIAINNSKPELSDPDVRRALAELVDVEKIIDVVEKGLGRQTVGIFNKKKPYYNSSLEPINLDIEKAKKTLKDEGWVDTNNNGSVDKVIAGKLTEMDLDMYITGSDLSKSVALLVQQNAKDAGVKINIITKPYSKMKKENIKKRDYDLAPLSLGQDLVLDDPYSKWHSDNDDPKMANDVSYRSPRSDALIDKIRSTQNEEERINYYKELQSVMYEDQPVIFLYNPKEKIIVNKKWNGKPTMKRPGYMPNTFTQN